LRKEKKISPNPSDLDFCSIAELTKALRSRKISAAELLQHVIARIESLDQRLNAVVVRDFERAQAMAKAADTALVRGDRRPAGHSCEEAVQYCRTANNLGLPRV
jgi:amidase